MKRLPVVVVGAGMGGLAAALDLAARGVEVLVVEQASSPGGKMRELAPAGRPMDAGPTGFTMRWVFEALFERAGTRLSDYVALEPLGLLARHAWSASERLDLHADLERSADAIGDFAGPVERRGFLAFSERAARMYRTLEGPFLRTPRPTPVSLAARAGFRGLPDLMRISPFVGLWQELGRYFRDPRLRQLFGRYATYCGSSPFLAPATLMLVAHVEQQGVWQVTGGMHRVAEAVAELAQERGARLRYGAAVAEILVEDARASGVRLASGERVEAAAVVFNGDAAAIARGALGAAAAPAVPLQPDTQRSLSAVTWNLDAGSDGFALAHHNVFFSSDYAAEFDAIARGRLPPSPTVYLCAQDGGRSVDAERMLLIVNAPARRDDASPLGAKELDACEAQTALTLTRCGLRLGQPLSRGIRTTPADFERLFPATGGALYGAASHGWKASFSRPGSRSRLPGLYLAGGSTHPGPGVPMAALSGSLAAASVLEDLPSRPASTARSPRTGTRGGTSTR